MKKDLIYVDGTEFLSFVKKSHGQEFVIYKLNTKDELFSATFNPGDVQDPNDNIYKLIFVNEDKTMEYSRPYWNKSLIVWLLEQDVLTAEGSVNTEKLELFIKKYDERLTERTIRVH